MFSVAQSLDWLYIEKEDYWVEIEKAFDKFLHKISNNKFPYVLNMLNKPLKKSDSLLISKDNLDDVTESNIFNDEDTGNETSLTIIDKKKEIKRRGSLRFMNLMVSILPMKVEKMTMLDVLRCVDVILDNNLKSDRLFNYFVYPKMEEEASKINFYVYIKLLKVLIRVGHEVRKNNFLGRYSFLE